MISFHQFVVLIIVLYCSSSGHNSEVKQVGTGTVGFNSSVLFPDSTGSPTCRLVRNLKRNLLEEFEAQFKNELDCSVDGQHGCSSVTCTSEYSQYFSGGIHLHVCENTPSIEFWTQSSNWADDVKWSHNFTIQETQQRVEIVAPIQGAGKNESFSKQYLNVSLNLKESKGRTTPPGSYPYLVLAATYELWTNESKEPIQQVIIVNSTRLPLNQICGRHIPQNLKLGSNLQSNNLHLIPLPQKRNEPKLENLHTNMNRKSAIGEPCDPKHIFRCGSGAGCSVRNHSYAVCECLADYLLASNGTCFPNPSHGRNVNPTVQPIPSANTNTYSSAMGATVSILILLVIAGAVYLGTRYNVFSRIRSRLPHELPRWPFRRRGMSIDDEVVMVDPFAHEDDDPPLL